MKEYKLIYGDGHHVEKRINDYSKQGYELMQPITPWSGGGMSMFCAAMVKED